jgi:ABC-type glucose/galactose transport system permease subunit
VIVLGIVLLVLGYLLPIPLVTTLGIILIVVGVILLLLGTVGGRPVGGRTHWL